MPKRLLKIFLVLIFLKSLVWMLLTPVFQIPDEDTHFGILQYIGETSHHPSARNPTVTSAELIKAGEIVKFNWMTSHPVWQGVPDDWLQQLNQIDLKLKSQFIDKLRGQKLPQVYFWLAQPAYALFKNQSFPYRFYSLRFFSVALSLAVALVAYFTGKLLFKTSLAALAIMSLVSFQPMYSYVSIGVTYDVLAIAVASLFAYFSLRYLHQHQCRDLIISAGLALLGPLVKTQLIALTLIFLFLLPRLYRRLIFISGLVIFLILYYFRSITWPAWFFYFTGFKDFSLLTKLFFRWINSGSVLTKLYQYFQQHGQIIWAEVFPWYWGVFGWLEKVMPLWVYRILKIVCGFSFIGLIKSWRSQRGKLISFLLIFSLIQAGVVFINDFIIYTQNQVRFGIQGRYFLAAMIPHMCLLLFGLQQLIPLKYRQLFYKTMIAGSLILNLAGLYSLYQYFGCPICSIL